MVDQIIRGAYKAALGLPVNTSNERPHDTGVYNTFEELKAAVLINQMERLCLTEAGQLLTELRYPVRPQYCSDRIHQIPSHIRKQIQATPIPKNMNPEYPITTKAEDKPEPSNLSKALETIKKCNTRTPLGPPEDTSY
ncbi:hypothetical protein HPB49_018849 [Dermacentor silvarum]|uniref:Uncharacterized protein n=1 Tax=Dermacentor silvarum TaxID=543639 RepID=A0ACB8D7P2_DERSI|nr:hypothetical protein HPB49_018849 [Dermacentor silvarum]